MNYQKNKILSTNISTIYYYPELKLAEIIWLDNESMNSENYRKTFLNTLESAKKNNIYAIISDIRKQSIVATSEKKWFKEQMFPLAAKAGLKNVAVITNENVFKIYYLNALNKLSSTFEINFKTFNNFNTALEWIKKNSSPN